MPGATHHGPPAHLGIPRPGDMVCVCVCVWRVTRGYECVHARADISYARVIIRSHIPIDFRTTPAAHEPKPALSDGQRGRVGFGGGRGPRH